MAETETRPGAATPSRWGSRESWGEPVQPSLGYKSLPNSRVTCPGFEGLNTKNKNFWPYQPLPSLTGLDRREAVEGLEPVRARFFLTARNLNFWCLIFHVGWSLQVAERAGHGAAELDHTTTLY